MIGGLIGIAIAVILTLLFGNAVPPAPPRKPLPPTSPRKVNKGKTRKARGLEGDD